MDFKPKAMAAVAGMAAATAHANAMCARSAAESAEKRARFEVIMAAYERKSCVASFVRELGAAGLRLDDLADWLGLMSGPELIHRGGMLPKDFVLGQVHSGEAVVPKACTISIGGAAGGGGGGCGGGQPAAFDPWPEMLALGGELLHEMRAARQQRKEQADRTAQLNEQVARLLQRWDGTSSSWRRYDGSAPSERA
ncbi:hypothetical protein [Delftia sp. UGAL515B_04]|uniref:hypothetical protein n=1 Tax=Delftia sp. UGAL515B_04 TaxID=2986766 RepID=UPI00295471B1|nr:hypothetical protein [Delftia sp. UGAL515B_04]WON88652.1 hypothetical protein OK021_28675 [Delftia sp. UGAL515B_04]